MKTIKCHGFPRSKPCTNIPGPTSKIWCETCEQKRKQHLNEKFKKIAKMYGIKLPENWPHD